MDVALFSSLLNNLLHVQVHCAEEDDAVFTQFEQKYCYNRVLQPFFSAEALNRLTADAQEHTFYGLQDVLGVCLILFWFEGRRFLVGPFVRSEFSESKVQTVLLRHHIPASFAESIRVYYSAFPVVSSSHMCNTIHGCICALSGHKEEFVYCRLRADASEPAQQPELREASLDYNVLHQRYDLENRFLRMIENGDVENVLIAQRAMTMAGFGQTRYVNAVYLDSGVGLAMLRAMSRKAAERGGASLVEIHEITQRAVQRMYAARGWREQSHYSDQMIIELTEAVRKNRQNLNGYSQPIRRVIEHIHLNYSQKLTLDELARIVHLSPSYLSRSFKEETHVTVSQYIEHLRCEKAAEMLRIGDTAVQEICSYVGYLDNNYFTKVFKKQFNMTPTDYRAAQHNG